MSDFSKPAKEGYKFIGSTYFSDAWTLFKKDFGSYLGASFLFVAFILFALFIPFVNLFFIGFGILAAVLMAGYYVHADAVERGTHKMGDFFSGFSFFLPLFLYRLVITLCMSLIYGGFLYFFFPYEIVLDAINGDTQWEEAAVMINMVAQEESLEMTLANILVYGISIYFLISYCLTLPLIVLGKLSFWNAMETSRRTVQKRFFWFLGFYILFSIGILITMVLTATIGILVILPLSCLVVYSMYNHIFHDGIKPLDAIDSFGDLNNEINTESQEGGR